MKQVSLECGGKSPHIVMADCPDLDARRRGRRLGHLLQPGRGLQRRLAPARRRDDQGRVPRAGRDGRSEDHAGRSARPRRRSMGAIVDETQLERVLGYIESGKRGGGEPACSAAHACASRDRRLLHRADGLRRRRQQDDDRPRGDLRPGALDDHVQRRRSEAIRIANDTIYGLAAAVWTGDVNNAPIARRGRCAPASCGSTASTTATSARRSAASSSRASAATSRSTRSTSSPT